MNDIDRKILTKLNPLRTLAAVMISLLCVFCFMAWVYIEFANPVGQAIGEGIEQTLNDPESLREAIWGVQNPPDTEALYDEPNFRRMSRGLQKRLGLEVDAELVIGDGAQITEQLLHGSLSERQGAAYILGEFGDRTAPLLPALIHALDDPDDAVRRFSAYALGEIGTTAESAIPKLKLLAESDDGRVSSEAAKAIAKILE